LLPGDPGFLLRHMPDAHLQFCLTCPHGVSIRVTPAMEARVRDRLWSLDELVERTSA
jgi:hypothetical protein